MNSLMRSSIALALLLTTCGVCNAVEVLKQEPTPNPKDPFAPGTVFLVDDGTCGRGKIKQLTIGNWTSDMTVEQAVSLRKRRCIAKK
jgi:uncharacterized protein DUF6719